MPRWTLSLAVVLACCALCGCGEQRSRSTVSRGFVPKKETVLHLRGEVLSTSLIGRENVLVTAVDSDPRYVLAVRVTGIQEEDAPIKQGEMKYLGLNNPQELFGKPLDEIAGRTYDFELNEQLSSSGQRRYRNLRVR